MNICVVKNYSARKLVSFLFLFSMNSRMNAQCKSGLESGLDINRFQTNISKLAVANCFPGTGLQEGFAQLSRQFDFLSLETDTSFNWKHKAGKWPWNSNSLCQNNSDSYIQLPWMAELFYQSAVSFCFQDTCLCRYWVYSHSKGRIAKIAGFDILKIQDNPAMVS
jgi:hypothetical protein